MEGLTDNTGTERQSIEFGELMGLAIGEQGCDGLNDRAFLLAFKTDIALSAIFGDGFAEIFAKHTAATTVGGKDVVLNVLDTLHETVAAVEIDSGR